jgi:hypothetical protein
MAQLKLGVNVLTAFLGDATEHQKGLLGLLKVGVVVPDKGRGRILGAGLFNLYNKFTKGFLTYHPSWTHRA